MENIIVIAIVGAIIFLAGRYIYREKKKGKTCVGCPYASQCGKGCCGSCSCEK